MNFYNDVKLFLDQYNLRFDIGENFFFSPEKSLLIILVYLNDYKRTSIEDIDSSHNIIINKHTDAKDLEVIYLYEDSWYFSNVAKERIEYKLGKSKSIYARKCKIISHLNSIKEEDRIKKFINNHHNLGWIKSPIWYALEYKENIVAVATFSNPIVTNRTNENKELLIPVHEDKKSYNFYSFEWTRYASLSDYYVIGGMSKLLQSFVNETLSKYQSDNLSNNINKSKLRNGLEKVGEYSLNNISYRDMIIGIEIMSYSDIEWGCGKSYEKLGFMRIATLPPIVKYVNLESYNRISKSNYRKLNSKTTEDKISNPKYVKIFNKGSYKWLKQIAFNKPIWIDR